MNYKIYLVIAGGLNRVRGFGIAAEYNTLDEAIQGLTEYSLKNNTYNKKWNYKHLPDDTQYVIQEYRNKYKAKIIKIITHGEIIKNIQASN